MGRWSPEIENLDHQELGVVSVSHRFPPFPERFPETEVSSRFTVSHPYKGNGKRETVAAEAVSPETVIGRPRASYSGRPAEGPNQIRRFRRTAAISPSWSAGSNSFTAVSQRVGTLCGVGTWSRREGIEPNRGGPAA